MVAGMDEVGRMSVGEVGGAMEDSGFSSLPLQPSLHLHLHGCPLAPAVNSRGRAMLRVCNMLKENF